MNQYIEDLLKMAGEANRLININLPTIEFRPLIGSHSEKISCIYKYENRYVIYGGENNYNQLLKQLSICIADYNGIHYESVYLALQVTYSENLS